MESSEAGLFAEHTYLACCTEVTLLVARVQQIRHFFIYNFFVLQNTA